MTRQRQPRRGATRLRKLAAALLLSAVCVGVTHAAAAEPGMLAPTSASTAAAGNGTWLRKDTAPKSKASAEPVSALRYTLFGVVLFSLALYALYRHQRRRNGFAPHARSELSLDGAVRVGPKAQVVVVSVAGRKLLLGVTESEVSRLAWLDDNSDVETEMEPERLEPLPPRAYAAEARSATLDGRRAVAAQTEAAPARIPHPVSSSPKSATQPKRFRDALFGALGQAPKAADAAVTIAESTHDVVVRTQPAPITAPTGAPEMVDVEGQARGLVMRLQKRA